MKQRRQLAERIFKQAGDPRKPPALETPGGKET